MTQAFCIIYNFTVEEMRQLNAASFGTSVTSSLPTAVYLSSFSILQLVSGSATGLRRDNISIVGRFSSSGKGRGSKPKIIHIDAQIQYRGIPLFLCKSAVVIRKHTLTNNWINRDFPLTWHSVIALLTKMRYCPSRFQKPALFEYELEYMTCCSVGLLLTTPACRWFIAWRNNHESGIIWNHRRKLWTWHFNYRRQTWNSGSQFVYDLRSIWAKISTQNVCVKCQVFFKIVEWWCTQSLHHEKLHNRMHKYITIGLAYRALVIYA